MSRGADALLTDLYQRNMLAAYVEHGLTKTAAFELFVRKLPERRGFLLAAGLEQALDYLGTASVWRQYHYLENLACGCRPCYGDHDLIADMDDKVLEQIANVAQLPGIVGAAYAMPDAHWGYGFPIGGVAAFDPDEGGVVSAGGFGFDISCGVRTLLTGLKRSDIEPCKEALAHSLSRTIPAGLGRGGRIMLDNAEMERMLAAGARWAVEQGYGRPEDLDRIEEHGAMPGAAPGAISARALQAAPGPKYKAPPLRRRRCAAGPGGSKAAPDDRTPGLPTFVE